MFPQQPQQQFRTAGANVQTFYNNSTWAKPPGVSHVYMMLIGGGADNDGAVGGGSGAVTVWYGAAQHVPDSLIVSVSTGNAVNTTVSYKSGVNAAGITLLTAMAGTTVSAGTAMTANAFTASGFFNSTNGQSGFGTSQTSSSITFLSGGNNGSSMLSNYGYSRPAGDIGGFFMLQPIIVGGGASGNTTARGGIGCGGGTGSGRGGPGLVLIASW